MGEAHAARCKTSRVRTGDAWAETSKDSAVADQNAVNAGIEPDKKPLRKYVILQMNTDGSAIETSGWGWGW